MGLYTTPFFLRNKCLPSRILDDYALDGKIARGSMEMLLDSADLTSQLIVDL
jgi:hypothetical protein